MLAVYCFSFLFNVFLLFAYKFSCLLTAACRGGTRGGSILGAGLGDRGGGFIAFPRG